MSKDPLFISDLIRMLTEGKPIEPEEALASFGFCSEIGYVVQNGDSIKNIIDAIQPSLSYEQLREAHQYMVKAAEHQSFKHKGGLKAPYEKCCKTYPRINGCYESSRGKLNQMAKADYISLVRFQPVITDPDDPDSQEILRKAASNVANARLYPMPKRKHRYDHRIGSEYRARNLADFLSKTNLDKEQSVKAIKLMKALELLVSNARDIEITPSEDNIARYLGLVDSSEDLKQFHKFCGDYSRVRGKWASDIELADKQYNYKLDLNDLYSVYKVIQNAAIGSVLGLFGNIEHYGVNLAVTAGTGAALTAYNETIGKRTMNLPAIWASTFVGGLIGSFFGDDQTGKYVGAGVGAGLSTVHEIIKSLKRRKKPAKPEEERYKQIDDAYIKGVEDLIIQYAT